MSLNTYGFVDDICMKSKSFDVSVSAKDKIIQVMDGNVLLASLSMTLSDNVLSLVGKNNEKVAEVKLPYSQMISDVYYDDENKEIVFIIEMNDGTISKFTINVEDLIVVYEGGHGIEITDNVISLKINDDSAKYLVSDNSGLSLKIDSLNDTFATDEEVSELLTKFATLNDLDLKQDKGDYITSSVADEIYQPKGEYATVTQLASKLDESTYVEEKSTFATKNELTTKVDTIDIIDMLTKTEASSLYQLKGDYLTEIPEEYITEKELNVKGYATTTQLANKLDISTYTADKTTFALKSEMPDVSNFITNTVDNLVNYYKKNETYTKSEIDGKISAITTINFEVVLELPISGESNKIYLVPNTEQDEQNIKDEYIWVEEKWEIIGSTKLDLSNYYNKGEVDSKLKAKVDLSTYTSDKEIFVLKSEISDMATQTWVNSKGYLTEHQDISNLATKQEVTEGLAGKQDKGDYALKSELPDISGFATKEELSSKANTSDLSNYVTTVNAEATYAKKSEIPSLEGYLQTSTADEKYATKTELEGKVDDADIADMLTKSEASETYQPKGEYLTEVPSEYITETELSEKGYLTSIPEEYVTETELSGKGYATTAQLANKLDTSTYTEDKATFALKSELTNLATKDELNLKANSSDLSNYLTTTDAQSNYATKTELSGKADKTAIADMLTKSEASETYQPKGEYLTAVPAEYVTETELSGKGYLTEIPSEYVTETELSEKGYATTAQLASKLDTSTYTEDKATFATKEELADKANTSDLSNYLQTSVAESTYAKKSEIPEEYTLPIATADLLGGIKVGAGLSINPGTGVLSATGGGTADSVDWANITSKPETFTPSAHKHVTADVTDLQDKLDAKADKTSIADMATKTWVSEQGYLTEHQDISQLATKQEVTEGLEAKQDKGNYITVETADGKYQVKGDYATTAQLANKVDTSTYTSDKATFALKSELTDFITVSVDNLVNYYKKSETYTKGEVDGKISAITTINFEVVGELPSSGEANKIYLVPNSEQGEQNVKDEYIWVDEKWEIIGSTKVDLSNYYNKGEVDSKLSVKVDLSTYTSDKETFALKSEISDMATQTWVTSQGYLTSHQDISNLATKQEVTEGLAGKQDKGDYALKSELPNISGLATKEELSNKADISDLNSYVTTVNAEATYAKKDEIPDISNLATKTELENKVNVGDIADMLTKTEASSTYQPKGNYAAIEYAEDFSDEDGYITTEIAPPNAMVIARMFLHPTLNMWCHCPSYETANKGNKIITGGIKYGVSVVVGGSTCQTFPNCKYRVYYINI